MDEGETKPCDNCKRAIPIANFTTHTLHCARHIRVCGACKEPVPLADLPAHHDRVHKLQPCAQCGERVCGADLEDHVRDSCAHTPASCRYCELELRRGALPPHERYCGARTERCAACGARVMHKYRQLHLDSNHGFVRLHDDPVPTENANVPKQASSNSNSSKQDLSLPKANLNRPQTEIRYFSAAALPNPNTCVTQNTSDPATASTSKPQIAPASAPGPSTSPPQQATSIPNTSYAARSQTNGTMSGVANPGRQAPPPMTNWANLNEQNNASTSNSATHDRNTNSISSISPCTSGSSDIASESSSVSQNGAVPRAKRSNHQPQVNSSSAAVPDKVNKNLWAGKKRPAPPPPDAIRERLLQSARRAAGRDWSGEPIELPPLLSAIAQMNLRNQDPAPERPAPGASPAGCAAPEVREREARGAARGAARRRLELRSLQPMSAAEFARRVGHDRFGQIKSSLRELRRGLSEVTAPYSSTVNNDSTQNEQLLPCEICDAPQPRELLAQHQAECRPDLSRLWPESRSESRSPSPPPVIPCEFCTASLPVYLISEHQNPKFCKELRRHLSNCSSRAQVQVDNIILSKEKLERCGRVANLLFPD